jgi:predicted NACHT family NTPase
MEFERKELEEWLKYIDEVLLKRINYAKGKGVFLSGVYLFANTKGKITKLANSFISLFSGVEQNKVPLSYEYVNNSKHKNYIYNFQLPKYNLNLDPNQKQKMFLYSKRDGIDWFSTKELSVIASLPQKEVVGLRLKEEVEFGLNVDEIEGDRLSLGRLISSGNELDIEIDLPLAELNKHIFITGVTGSGKTTTCQKILNEAKLPFLVIEPAKTEYRNLANLDGVTVFTLGIEATAPFRINPFEFYEGENIPSRVDMIKATIESSFDMRVLYIEPMRIWVGI